MHGRLSADADGGAASDGVSFNIVIDACGKARQLQLAFHYLAEMRQAGWPPTVSTYTSLIDACGKSFELDLCACAPSRNPFRSLDLDDKFEADKPLSIAAQPGTPALPSR